MKAKVGAAALAVAFSGAVFTGGASAGTINLQNATGETTPFGTPAWAREVAYTINGEQERSIAGLFRLEDSDSGQGILAWCVELLQDLNLPGEFNVNAISPATAVAANLNKLFNTSYHMILDEQVGEKKEKKAAGFQLAIWEIITDSEDDDGLDLTNGGFIVTEGDGNTEEGVANNADFYLNRVANAEEKEDYILTYFNSPISQDLVNAEVKQVAAIPVPAAGLLLLSGLAGFGALRRRRKS